MKHYLLLLITLFTAHMAWAGPVDQEAAREKAANFVAAKMGGKQTRQLAPVKSAAQKAPGKNASQRDYFHVFNIDGGGFVIVSGDDRTEEILGYSTTGTYDADRMPENMRVFMQSYVDGIKKLDETSNDTLFVLQKHNRSAKARAPKTSISPLLSTTWDQLAPYSLYCPRASDGRLTLTGCVATAMAQVMGYHKWPAQTTKEIPAYSKGSYSVAATPANTTIDWANIKDSYTTYSNASFTEAQADDSQKAIARLMQLCGQSVFMDYGTGASSATTAICVNALIEYFDYDASAKWLLRKNYSYSEWQDIIYGELAAGRPVLYDGQSAGGGHAFVCDGYDSDDFFHINWGWSGSSNGNFRLRLLNPQNQGAGGSSTNEGYGVDQGAGIGIRKNGGSSNNYNGLYITSLTTEETSLTRTSTDNPFYLPTTFHFANYGLLNSQYTAFLILDSENNTIATEGIGTVDLSPAYYYISNWTKSLSLPSTLPDGTYKIVIGAREDDLSDYKICAGSDANYILVTISGTSLTIGHGYSNIDVDVTADVTGDGEVNSPQTITIHIKNNGTAYRNNLSYRVGSGSYMTAAYVEVEPGETKDFTFDYTPTSVGTTTLYIYNERRELLTTVDVVASAVSGTATLAYDDYKSTTPALQWDDSKYTYYVNGNKLTATFRIKNVGDKAFNGKLLWVLWKRLSDGTYNWKNDQTQESVSIAAGESKLVSYTATKPSGDDYDLFQVELYWINGTTASSLAATEDFEFRESSSAAPSLELIEYSSTPELKEDNGTYYIEGEKASFKLTIKNTGTTALNGKMKMLVQRHFASSDTWYTVLTTTYTTTLDAGLNMYTTVGVEKSALTDVDKNRIQVVYTDANDVEYEVGYTPEFTFRESSTPTFKLTFDGYTLNPDVQYDYEKSINYIEGNQTTVTFKVKNEGDAAFDGQIVLVNYKFDPSQNVWTYNSSTEQETRSLTLAAGASTNIEFVSKKDDDDTYTKYMPSIFYKHESLGSGRWDLGEVTAFEFRGGGSDYEIVYKGIGSSPSIQYDNNSGLNYIDGDNAQFYVALQNNGTGAFKGQVMIEQAVRYAGSSQWYYINSDYPEYRDVSIPAGTMSYVYSNFSKSSYADAIEYFIRFRYKGDKEESFVTLGQSDTFVFMDTNTPLLQVSTYSASPAVQSGDFNGDGVTDYYVDGNSTTITFTVKNVGRGAFSGQAKLKYWKLNSESGDWEQAKTATTHTISVAANGSTQVSGTIEKDADSKYTKYAVEVFYVSGDDDVFLGSTPDFEFHSQGDGIERIGTTTVQPTDKVYNLRGQLMGTVSQMDQLPAGVYIVNGKKVAVRKK